MTLGTPLTAPDPDPEVLRQAILDEAVAAGRGIQAALFEVTEGSAGSYRPVALSPGLNAPDPCEFAADGALLRWLRVNDDCLPIPDDRGVVDDVTEREQGTLRALGVRACVPLVDDASLVAWIALVSGASAIARDCADRLQPRAHAWASRLHEAKSAWAARARSETVSQANRLSVTGQLAASIAHEVRNPLAAIRSTVQMVRDLDAPPGDHSRLLTMVMAEVDRVNAVLSRMLTLGRPHHANLEICDIRAIADDAAGFCTAYTKNHGQQIVRTGTRPLWTLGDPHELWQVLVNVILNGCQASDKGTQIVVETLMETDAGGPSWSVVRVIDRGVGVPPADLTRVFEPFYTTKPNGGGLGLAICHDIVGRHDGRIEITSRLGAGTQVTIRLPWKGAYDPHPGR